jgi:hypothetical protein
MREVKILYNVLVSWVPDRVRNPNNPAFVVDERTSATAVAHGSRKLNEVPAQTRPMGRGRRRRATI